MYPSQAGAGAALQRQSEVTMPTLKLRKGLSSIGIRLDKVAVNDMVKALKLNNF